MQSLKIQRASKELEVRRNLIDGVALIAEFATMV